MSVSKLFARITLAAVAVLAWTGSHMSAADVAPPAPMVVAAAPVIVGEPGCPTCEHGIPASNCTKCGKLFSLHRNKKEPYPVNLCPGACFGYFQTQWRKWDEVCPYPYTGIGISDAPRLPGSLITPPGTLTPPRPVEPKMPEPKKMPDPKKTGSYLPPIPVVPTTFAR